MFPDFNMLDGYWIFPDGKTVYSSARQCDLPVEDEQYQAYIAAGGVTATYPIFEDRVTPNRAEMVEMMSQHGVIAYPDAPEQKIAEIKARLSVIDSESVRPLRAVANGEATKYDTEKLAALDAEAAQLRAELAALAEPAQPSKTKKKK